MLLVELIRLPGWGRNLAGRWQTRTERWGLWAALPLGVLLALGFCPASAAIFFGSVLWMAARHDSWLLLPLAYGLGAALPVVAAAGVLAFSAQLLGRLFAVTALLARWGQRIAGTVLIMVGVYFAVRFIF
jgi:cytochrome c biogenesis protein CcdA